MQRFKLNEGKPMALGLTEGLDTGDRLAPRGRALLDALSDVDRDSDM